MSDAKHLPYEIEFNLSKDLRIELGRENCPIVRDAADIAKMLNNVTHFPREFVMAGALDIQNRLLHWSLVAIGNSNFVSIRLADVFHGAILVNGSLVVLAHNHPSGSLEPSRQDFDLTQKVAEAGLLLGYPLLDHVIVSSTGHKSLLSKATLDRYKKKSRYLTSVAHAFDGNSFCAKWKCPKCTSDNVLETIWNSYSMGTRCEECDTFVWLTKD
jgi:hypothetical protein